MVIQRWLRVRSACLTMALLAAFCCLQAGAQTSAVPRTIQFNRDIRPILSENCFACHEFDKNKRKADLRLDKPEGLFQKHDGGMPVVPRHPEQSELYRRVITDDADDHMPPEKSGKKLSVAQKESLRLWIAQGAPW